jgi:TonB family protein
MTMRRWLALALLCAAMGVNASTPREWHRNDMLENSRYQSTNGRFVLVVRHYPVVGDFASVRVDTVTDFDSEDGFVLPSDGDPETETAALYEVTPRRRVLASVLKIAQDGHSLLISDSGDRIIVEGPIGWNGYRHAGDPLLEIYDARGTLIRTFLPADVFTPSDVEVFIREQHQLDMSLQVDGNEGEVIAISVDKIAAVRIRTADGTLVDPLRDLLPAPRVYASSTTEPASLDRFDDVLNDACFEGTARIASSQLVARAVQRPLPPFPVVAVKARIRGRVWVEMVISESGHVICARATQLPFGIREAALAAARQWKFTPYEIDGRPVRVTSEVLFHFEDVTPSQWEELQRQASY